MPTLFDNQSIANLLTRDGLHWSQTTLTYSFNNQSTAGNALDATFQLWVNRAVHIVEEMIGIDLVQTAGAGNITFNGSRDDGTYATGDVNGPNNDISWASVFFDQSWDTNQSADLSYGSYGFLTIIHELLHTLGLEHPGYYNGTAIFNVDALFLQDTQRYSVMSYFDAISDYSGSTFWFKENGVWKWMYPQTPMVFDLLALSDGAFGGFFAGYNLSATTRAGETTYGYNVTAGVGAVLNFDINHSPVLTIYDAGGIDTLDLSGDQVTMARIVYNHETSDPTIIDVERIYSLIDIRQGHYSSTHGMTNNIGISYGTLIENVVGTIFRDTIYGNELSNTIYSNDGHDIIYGGYGDDVIYSGDGGDRVYGDEGNDRIYGDEGADEIYGQGGSHDLVSYIMSPLGINVALWLAGNFNEGGFAEGDVLRDIEDVIGSNFNDFIAGDTGSNALFGGAGNDVINGYGGVDIMTGGAGVDWYMFADHWLMGVDPVGTITDFAAGELVFFAGSNDPLVFSVFGQNVLANGITLQGAAASNVTVVTQESTWLVGGRPQYAVAPVISGGIGALGANGNYEIYVFDANADELWQTIKSSYTSASTLNSTFTVYDTGQPYAALFSDYDQDTSQTWNTFNTYFSTPTLIDLNWVTYDYGQPLHASSTNFDQAAAANWSEIQTFYSTPGVTDFSYIYYDAGQPLYCSSVNYDQAANQTWSRIETFLSSAAATDFYWTYYDAGQPYFAATVDYDQTSGNTWSNIQTFFASAGVTDFTWAYFDAGQPLYARLIDYDQGNLYAWSQHVVEYDTSTHVLNDYYV